MDATVKPIKKQLALAGIILSVVLLIIWEVLAKLFVPTWSPGSNKNTALLYSRILFWVYFFVVWLYARKVEKQPLLLWPSRSYPVKNIILSVITLMLVIMAGSAVINITVKLLHLTSSVAVLKNFKDISIPIKLLTVITAAVAEELIFRGYLMPRIQLFFKSEWPPIIISSLIFGFAHISYGTVSNIAGPLLIGVVFGWYYQKYRDLKALIICHFIIDFTALFLIG